MHIHPQTGNSIISDISIYVNRNVENHFVKYQKQTKSRFTVQNRKIHFEKYVKTIFDDDFKMIEMNQDSFY